MVFRILTTSDYPLIKFINTFPRNIGKQVLQIIKCWISSSQIHWQGVLLIDLAQLFIGFNTADVMLDR